MDRALPKEVYAMKKRKLLLIAAASIIVILTLIMVLRNTFRATVPANSITTAVVETGDVENTITASGEVLPEFEEVITSPVQAAILEVLADAGTSVVKGQSLLKLDKAAIQSALDKAKFLLESKENNLRKLKLELNKSYFDLKSGNDIKQLRISSLEAEVESARRLFKAGGGTRESVEQAEMNLKVARLEKIQLENEIQSKQQTMKVEIRESEIEVAIQRHELSEMARKKELAGIIATRPGVITWINKNVGASIGEGAELVRIADLSSFKIAGSISDAYLEELHNGMPVIVGINNKKQRGEIVAVYPSVKNGLVNFDVRLDTQDSLLRPSLKVDVYVVTNRHANVLRVQNGPAFTGGGGTQDVFVVKGEKAERRTVQKGLSNFDYVELAGNIRAGEVIITSDMSSFKNAREIIITK
ncbi:MAG: efflux RND transporter periplasmic adaptor subunit [Chitinophagaceae bacterium]